MTADRVVIIGFDALDQALVRRWAGSGDLPTFASLMERGAWGLVDNQPNLEAGSAWPSFSRGVGVNRHGQLDGLRIFNQSTYGIDDDRGEEPFLHEYIWRRLSREGRRVAVIDAPYSLVSEDLNGVEINGWGVHAFSVRDGHRVPTWPPELESEVARRFGVEPLGHTDCDVFAPRSRRAHEEFRDRLIERAQTKGAMIRHFLAEERWDFFLGTFSESHCAGHHGWTVTDSEWPGHDPKVAAAIGDPIKDVYRTLDAELGTILGSIDDEDTTVLVYTSHGMERGVSGSILLDKILVRLAGGEVEDRTTGFTGTLRSAWRRLPPTARQRLAPVMRRVWTSGVGSAFQGDRAGRQFFEIFANNSTGGVRINLRGRERDGTVEPGAEFDELVTRLRADLAEVVNDDTGTPIAARIIDRRDLYPTGERVDHLPDLLVEWDRIAPTGPIRSVSSPKIGTITHSAGPRSGDHGRTMGMFLALGPRVRPGQREENVSVTDFAPTIASILGASLAEFDGTPIAEICGVTAAQ